MPSGLPPGAGRVVTGNLFSKNGQVSISITGTNTDNGSQFWSSEYGQPINKIFELPGEMAIHLLEKLDVHLREQESVSIRKPLSQNAEAYKNYLKGRFYGHRSGEDLNKSLIFYQKAAELDQHFSRALAGMAKVNLLIGYNQFIPFNEALNRAKEAAVKALQIDSSLTEAWSSLAFINMAYEWQWPEAENDFRKVFAVNPAHASAKEKYTRYLDQILANFEEAETEPVTTLPLFLYAYSLLHRGKFEEALRAAHKAVSHDSNSFMAQRALGLSYMGLENYEESIKALQKAASLSNRHAWILFELMGAYMQAGKIEDAQAIMDEALADSNALPFMIHNFFFPGQ